MQNEEKKKRLLTENSSVMNLIKLGLTRKLFQKYLSNQANAKEQEIVESWDAEAYWNKYLKKTLDPEVQKGCKEVWKQVSKQIHTENPSVKYGQYPAAKSTTRIARLSFSHSIRKYAAVAAMFLLIAGTTLFFITRQTNSDLFTAQQALTKISFQTRMSNLKIVKLPDGSKITLNSETKLSIVENQFNKKLREVWLEGEAFFEVAKNKEKPFIIHTGSMQTTVCGTSFNVKAYPELDENVVSVRTGKVKISAQEKILAMLTPGKQITYHTSNGNVETQDIDATDIAGWTEGKLVLNNANTKELCLRLRQQFGVTVRIQDDALLGKLISGTFRKGSTLNEILSTIGEIHNVHYKISNNSVTISRTEKRTQKND